MMGERAGVADKPARKLRKNARGTRAPTDMSLIRRSDASGWFHLGRRLMWAGVPADAGYARVADAETAFLPTVALRTRAGWLVLPCARAQPDDAHVAGLFNARPHMRGDRLEPRSVMHAVYVYAGVVGHLTARAATGGRSGTAWDALVDFAHAQPAWLPAGAVMDVSALSAPRAPAGARRIKSMMCGDRSILLPCLPPAPRREAGEGVRYALQAAVALLALTRGWRADFVRGTYTEYGLLTRLESFGNMRTPAAALAELALAQPTHTQTDACPNGTRLCGASTHVAAAGVWAAVVALTWRGLAAHGPAFAAAEMRPLVRLARDYWRTHDRACATAAADELPPPLRAEMAAAGLDITEWI